MNEIGVGELCRSLAGGMRLGDLVREDRTGLWMRCRYVGSLYQELGGQGCRWRPRLRGLIIQEPLVADDRANEREGGVVNQVGGRLNRKTRSIGGALSGWLVQRRVLLNRETMAPSWVGL